MQNRLKHFQSKYLQHENNQLINMTNDQLQYDSKRSTILAKPTNIEYQTMSRIAKIERQGTNDEQYPTKWDRCLIIHYNHEQRLSKMKKTIHQLWDTLFINTSIHETRLIVGSRNNRNAKRELIHTRPGKPTIGTMGN